MRGKHARRPPVWRRPAVLGLAVLVALGGAGGIWAAAGRSGSSGPRVASGGDPTSAVSTTSVPVTDSKAPTSTSSIEPATSRPSTTVVTEPVSAAIGTPVTEPGSVRYTMASGQPIKVVASNRCWIEVRRTAGGPVIQTTTLVTGQTLSLTSPVWMRLGDAANVRVSAGSVPLQLPTGYGDLVISPA